MTAMSINDNVAQEDARIFTAQSVVGAARMVLQSPKPVSELIGDMSLPKGTTVEAIKLLNEKGFGMMVKEAFNAAVKRSAEIAAEERE